jgi:hypothetical protein
MSVNERAKQNVWHFQGLVEGENEIFFTTFCDPYMGHTFILFCTFHQIKDIKDGFE